MRHISLRALAVFILLLAHTTLTMDWVNRSPASSSRVSWSTAQLEVEHFLQGRFIANDQGRSLQLQ
jgi:hypothetical protein